MVSGITRPQQFVPIVATKPSKRHAGLFRSLSFSSIASYLGVFLLILAIVTVSYQPPKHEASVAAAASDTTSGVTQQAAVDVTKATAVDSLMATSIGATIAESTSLPVAKNVTNLSQSLATESMLAQTDTNTISKPQIADITADTHTVREYTTVAGDTAATVAARYGLSSQTIRWANGLSSDAIEAGRKLTIPPVDGVIYTVHAGDTVDSIAAKYGANRQDIVALNDLELVGNPTAGQQLTIPNGNLPENERPGYQAPRTATSSATYSGGYGTASRLLASAGNGYAFGNCTWYAYERRVQLGLPVGSFWGNASTWAYNAQLAGLLVDGNPAPGAIMQNGGGYGHVAIVEGINPGVSITISEMNGYRFGGGFNRIGHGDIPWSEAVSGMYRYIH